MTMKHLFLGISAFFFIWLFTLPLYAQDTTITIYGKKFAPGVIVKLNGKTVDSVRHDSAQPSRILYVKVRLRDIRTGTITTIAGTKDGGATLTSADEAINTLETQNPDLVEPPTTRTFVGKTASPRIWITQVNITDSLRSLRLRVPLNSRRDTLLRINFQRVPVGTNISLQLSDSSRFSIYDSTNTQRLWSFSTIANSTSFPFTIRYNAPSTLLQGNGKDQVTLNLIGRQNSKINVQRSFALEGIPIQTIQIIAAFTARVSNKPYYDTSFVKDPNNPTLPGNEQDDIEKTVNNPQQLMRDYLQIFNTYLAKLDSNGSTDKIARTQFLFAESPFQIQYQEQSSNTNIFADLDALQGNDAQESPTGRSGIQEISTKQTASNLPTILLVNSETVPYRAITSSCQTNQIPKYIIVEIKYLNSFLSLNYLDRKFFEALAAIINQ